MFDYDKWKKDQLIKLDKVKKTLKEDDVYISLKNAYLFRLESPVFTTNSYNWYRDYAKKYGEISIRKHDPYEDEPLVPCFKIKGTWHIKIEDLKDAIEHNIVYEKKEKEEKEKQMIEYEASKVYTDYGYYIINGAVRYENRNGYTESYCNICNTKLVRIATARECHICRDWGDCGTDCERHIWICPKCKNVEDYEYKD